MVSLIANRQRIVRDKRSPESPSSPYEEIRLLTVQAAKYRGRHRRTLLKTAIAAAYNDGHPINIARNLEGILPLADTELQIQITEKILPKVADYKWEDVVAVVTASLLPYSDGAKRVERLRTSLQRMFTSRPNTFRKVDYSIDQVMLAMTRFWCEFPDDELYRLWLEILDDISQLSRPDLLVTLAALVPLITQLGDADIRQQVIDAIEDVDRWWP